MLPTVGSILDLPVLREAAPLLLGGAGALDNPVRWVHVSELLDISGLLSGGELVLTTGLELEKEPGLTASFIRSLEKAAASGLIVELVGDRKRSMDALRAAALAAAMPVIVVERRVRFVQVTEIVHRIIVAEQLERVERARDVHEAFTVLSLESAGTGQVVEQAAVMIGAPVVLEDLSHLVLAYSARAAADRRTAGGLGAAVADHTVAARDGPHRARGLAADAGWRARERLGAAGGAGRPRRRRARRPWCWNVRPRPWRSTGSPNGTGES